MCAISVSFGVVIDVSEYVICGKRNRFLIINDVSHCSLAWKYIHDQEARILIPFEKKISSDW